MDIPDGAWLCPFCSSEPMPAKIAKILSWRWAEAPYTEIDDERPGKEGQKRKLWGHKVCYFYLKPPKKRNFSTENSFASLLVFVIGTATGLTKFEWSNIQVNIISTDLTTRSSVDIIWVSLTLI